MLKIWFRRAVLAGVLVTAAAVVTVATAVLWVRAHADGHVYAEADVPAAPVALVLGAEIYADNEPSPFLSARLDIALRLYQAHKVRAILVSGDHGRWDYDEPGAMSVYLISRGVPADKVVLDYAGFDTYDSCARAHRIFGVNRAIVVTQSYHVQRAVALCRDQGIATDGVGDDTARVYQQPWRAASTREYGADVKALWDVATGRDPVFLGPHEVGVDAAVVS